MVSKGFAVKEMHFLFGTWDRPTRQISITTNDDFNRMLMAIRERPVTSHTGFWFNLIEYRGNQFIQGELCNEDSQDRDLRHVAALVEGVRTEDIEGFWPEIQGYPVEKWEEEMLISYLSRQGSNDLELIVPERNRAKSAPWGRFDESSEFETYKTFIHPAVIDVLETVEAHLDMNKVCL